MAAKKARHDAAKEAADELAKNTSHSEKKLMEYNRRKGAGAIFTTIPLERYGFDIKCKEDYRDILRLRYRLGFQTFQENAGAERTTPWITLRYAKRAVSYGLDG